MSSQQLKRDIAKLTTFVCKWRKPELLCQCQTENEEYVRAHGLANELVW